MTSQRPRRPIPASSLALQQASQPPVGIPTQEYADKANLAQHLHDQGINPLLWTKAHPAPFADQEEFRKTGRKARENQFEVGGRLYDATPDIAATPAQGRAAFGTYLKEIGDPDAEDAPPLESFVEIEKVPLQHPLGQAATLAGTPESAAILRNMIKTRIDPKNAHLGDPLPMPVQDRLKQMFERKLMAEPGSEPETSDLLYRNADGWIYAKNDATREAEDVLKIRAKHTEKRAQQAGTAPDAAANDNDPEEEEEIFRLYMMRDAAPHEPAREAPVAAGEEENSGDDELTFNQRAAEEIRAIAGEIPDIVSAIEKAQAGQTLSDREQQVLAVLTERFDQIGLKLDPAKTNLAYLRDVAKSIENANAAVNSTTAGAVSAQTFLGRAPLHVAAQALNNELAQALVGSTVPWAQISQHGFSQVLQQGLNGATGLGRNARRAALLTGAAATGGLTAAKIARELALEDGNPDIFSPYVEDSASTEQPAGFERTASGIDRTAPTLLGDLTAKDVDAIENIFDRAESTFNRDQRISIGEVETAEILREGTIEEIEVFGLILFKSDPRGNEQTQRRVDILKQLVREKMIECGMEIEKTWGGENPDKPGERFKERLIRPADDGLKGARRADLSFRISWKGKTYIIDINTVDVLKNGLPTSREFKAYMGLITNRLFRVGLANKAGMDPELIDYEGKVGTIGKGKGLSDEEWTEEAKRWVEDFLDCDAPLNTDVYDESQNDDAEQDE